MKVFFATPPLSRGERYGALAGGGSAAPALGLLCLAAVCRRAGWQVEVLDAAALDLGLDEVLRRLAASRPDVLALSATTLAVASAAELARQARRRLPSLRVILGGPHVSAAPVETLRRFPDFDAAVVGEGEATILELLAALAAGGLEGIAGLALPAAGSVRLTPRRPPIRDLDRLPLPAWDLLAGFPQRYAPAPFKTRRLPAASLVTSRGCPNECIFCDRSVFGRHCHAFSPGYVIEMMLELYYRHGVREFCFEDDTFVTFDKNLVEICQRLIELDLGISWSCLGRVNHIRRDRLELMKRAGCWQISFGIESGNQEILDRINKKVTLEQIREALRLSRQAGLMNKGFFIVGHPGETRATLRQSIDFALELPLDDLSVTMLTPFPGSAIYERAEEFGTLDRDWGRMNLLQAVFVPFGLTREDLEAAQKELLRRFYLRPRIVLNYARRAAANPALARSLWGGFRSFLRSI